MIPAPAAHAADGILLRRRPTVASALALLLVLIGSLLLTAGPATAHASLVSTDPSDGEQLDAAPTQITVTFNEPVEVPSGAVRVFDADAERVDLGPVETGSGAVVAVALPDDLPDGGYAVTYRVLSSDAHPIGGVSTFTIGEGAALDDAVVSELGAGAAGTAARSVGIGLRGIGYLATLLAAGAALFAVTVARQPKDRQFARRIAALTALVGAGVAVVSLPVQAVAVSADGISAAVSTVGLREVLVSSFGLSAAVRAGALLALTLVWRSRTPSSVLAGAGLVAAASFVLDGHQRSVDPTWLLAGGDVIHLLAAASWFGGLVMLVASLRRRSLADDPVEAAGLVARFSTTALWSFVLVAVGGVAMAVPLVGSPSALTSTTYGWLLVGKVAAVGVVVVLAAYNRQRLVPAIAARGLPAGGSVDTPPASEEQRLVRADAAWRQLRRTVRIEAVVLVAVLLTTAALVTVQPASEAAGLGGIYETTAPFGDELEIDLVVDPNRAGRNTMHLYVLDAAGRPSDQVDDLQLELTYVPEGIGPIVIEPFVAGPGHWVATVDDLIFAGDWEVRVVGGLDRFTEVSSTLTVPVAP